MQNLFIGKGNLAKSPTLQRIKKKNSAEEFVVANMRVFFGRYGTDQGTGEISQIGGFWREVEIYGSKAEACAQHLRRGARVLVIGEERDFYGRDENGNDVQVIKIVAEDVALQLSRIESITFAQSQRENAEKDVAEEPA
ncbi:single-stranded DNA-binding protein [Diaphorobacter sp. HDW4B]|nr:single-stranded DNA-binding protein [Diaphorobacter sp. HDW4B]